MIRLLTLVQAARALRGDRGMTFLEVVIAVGVITIGLLALIAAMPAATGQIGEANLKTTATFLAQQRLEQIKNARWCAACGTSPPDSPLNTLGGEGSHGGEAVAQWPDEAYGTIVFPGAESCGATARSGGCRFRRQVRIRDCSSVQCGDISPAAAVQTLRQVTVTVFFFPLAATGQGQNAIEESVQLVTLISQRP